MIGIYAYQYEALGHCADPRAWYVSYKPFSNVGPLLQSSTLFPTTILMGWPWPANPVWANVNPDRMNAVTAHGTIMGFAFALLFPLGAILIRTASFRGLVVRSFSEFILPVRDCLSSRETCCRSNVFLPLSSLPKHVFPFKFLSTDGNTDLMMC